ncbi:MAG: prepilin-type N-terminal cleavage/methylation domain-containing protein [Patescibacteria group bacterium]|jgi:prepilin-type N-terminal cleavage/methylation domain-containing protein
MKKQAFTLIELLVVVFIVGVVATTIIISSSTSKAKARDAQRKSDLGQIQDSLELFHEANDYYPTTHSDVIDCWRPQRNWLPNKELKDSEKYSYNYSWSDPYLTKQPHDPIDTCLWPFGTQGEKNDNNPTAAYAYGSDNSQRYYIAARLEISSDTSTIQNAHTKGWNNNILYPDYWTAPRAYVIVNK